MMPVATTPYLFLPLIAFIMPQITIALREKLWTFVSFKTRACGIEHTFACARFALEQTNSRRSLQSTRPETSTGSCEFNGSWLEGLKTTKENVGTLQASSGRSARIEVPAWGPCARKPSQSSDVLGSGLRV